MALVRRKNSLACAFSSSTICSISTKPDATVLLGTGHPHRLYPSVTELRY